MTTINNNSITIKVAYLDDMRRFSVPETISFADFMADLVRLFKLQHAGAVKYIDDEGDAIVIASDDELREAFRLAREQKPPILRVSIQAATPHTPPPVLVTQQPLDAIGGAPAVAPGQTTVIEVETTCTFVPPASPKSECSQYPPLDVAFWDAPAKTLSSQTSADEQPCLQAPPSPQIKATTTIVLPTEGDQQAYIYTRIAQQTADYCASTSRSVSQCSRDTTDDTLKCSESMLLEIKDSGLVHSTVSLCSDLSRKIADECRALSLQTAEISRRLATERAAETHGYSGHGSNDLGQLTAAVTSFTTRLSAETAQMCRNLSQATCQQTLPL